MIGDTVTQNHLHLDFLIIQIDIQAGEIITVDMRQGMKIGLALVEMISGIDKVSQLTAVFLANDKGGMTHIAAAKNRILLADVL